MAKRFTDTEKYKKSFIRALPGAYKIFWDYLYHDCNFAGIWQVDFEVAQIRVGKDMPINEAEALKYFNVGEERIKRLNGGTKWLIIPFIDFQYGKLNPNNRVHASVLGELQKYGIKGLASPLQGAKDKDKEKDKDKDKEKDNTLSIEAFNILLNNKEFMGQLEALYPNVPIEKELLKMKAWVLANPERAKKNWKRFMVNWLNKAMDNYPMGAAKGKRIETPKRENIEARWPTPPKEFTDLINKIGRKVK